MLISGNYKTLKVLKTYINWKDIPCLWIGRLTIVKMGVLPKLSYRFNTIPLRIPGACFAEIDKLILKFMWKLKGPRIAETIMKKRNKFGRLPLCNFRTYFQAIVIKTV